MNPISAFSWFWKALRGYSVTFAVLLAFALLGVSLIQWLKGALKAMGAPWLAVFILPTVVIGLLAKNERVWIVDDARRKFWSRGILIAAVTLSAGIAILRKEDAAQRDAVPSEHAPASSPAESAPRPIRPRGPSGK